MSTCCAGNKKNREKRAYTEGLDTSDLKEAKELRP